MMTHNSGSPKARRRQAIERTPSAGRCNNRKRRLDLLDLTMPNGKALRDNTLADVEHLVRFFTKLAERMQEA
jgi:hypothetical protein